MAGLYAGAATITLPDGTSVDVDVDLWREQQGPLVQWGGTATSQTLGSLWNGEQRACTVTVGTADLGFRVGECMIVEPVPADGTERVALRGSGDFTDVGGPP